MNRPDFPFRVPTRNIWVPYNIDADPPAISDSPELESVWWTRHQLARQTSKAWAEIHFTREKLERCRMRFGNDLGKCQDLAKELLELTINRDRPTF